MATKKFLHDIDLVNVGQLKNARIHNVTSTELDTLAGELGASNRGFIVYNTTDSTLYTWNGSSFDKYTFEVTGDIQFKGFINPSSSSSKTPVSGHQYIADAAGALSTQGGTITYSPSANVEVGDIVLFTSNTTASIFERNLEQATSTTTGTVKLANQGEVNAGVNSSVAVTPFVLHNYVNPMFTADRARLTTLEADVNTVEVNLATEISARSAADTTLQSNIDSEATARASADTTLQSNIDSETATRATADETLQDNIDSEATARASADTTLQDNIDSEASTRAAADSALDGRVTTLEARDEVLIYTASVDLVADTALTVSHNLDLTNKDVFVINVMHNGEQVSVSVTSVNVNSLTVTSAASLTGAVITIIGF